MTAPIRHGYPDWGRYQARSDITYLDLVGDVTGAGKNYGTFFVGGTTHLGAHIQMTAGRAKYFFTFYPDLTAPRNVGQLDVDLRLNGLFRAAMPVHGAYVNVTMVSDGASSTNDIRLWSASGPIPWAEQSAHNVLFARQAAAAPVGTTIFASGGIIFTGEVHWTATSLLGAWYAFLQHVSYTGTVTFLDEINYLMGDSSHRVFVPPGFLQIRFDNGTAGAGFCDLFATGHPYQIVV